MNEKKDARPQVGGQYFVYNHCFDSADCMTGQTVDP